MTLNGHCAPHCTKHAPFGAYNENLNEDRPRYRREICSPMTLVSCNISFMRIFAGAPYRGRQTTMEESKTSRPADTPQKCLGGHNALKRISYNCLLELPSAMLHRRHKTVCSPYPVTLVSVFKSRLKTFCLPLPIVDCWSRHASEITHCGATQNSALFLCLCPTYVAGGTMLLRFCPACPCVRPSVCASRNIVNTVSCRVFDTFSPNL